MKQLKSDLYSQAKEEKHYLYDAAEYLKEKRDFDYDLINDVKSQIIERRDTIQSYAINKRDELQDEVIENRNRIQEQVLNKRDSKRKELSD